MKNFITSLFAVSLLLIINNVSAQGSVSKSIACNQTFQFYGSVPDFSGSRGFVYSGTSPYQLNSQSLANTNLTPIGSPVTFGFIGAASVRTSNGTLWVNSSTSPYTLFNIDTTTGVKTTICNCTGIPQTNFTGLTWDNTGSGTLYGVSTNLTSSQIFSINTSTGVCTPKGSASSTCAGAIFIACSKTGTIFAGDIVTNSLFKVNKNTGVFTLVGALGVSINFSDCAQFDQGDNKLYWINNNQLNVLDTISGFTYIGIYSTTVHALAIFSKYVGIKEDKNDIDVSVYPNPVRDIVTITAPNIETIKVSNLAGQIMENIIVNNNNTILNVSKYDAGVYFLQVKTDKGLFTKKIIVTKL